MTEHMFDTGAVAARRDVSGHVDTSMLVPAASLARRTLPVHDVLAPLFVNGGLECGTVVSVAGSTSLVMALVGAASQAGSWVAVVGMADLGLAALVGCGVVADRVLLVDHVAQPQLPRVLAVLAGAVDVIVVGALSVPAPRVGRRLATVVRERSTVMITTGPPLPGLDPWMRLRVVDEQWEGLGDGHGYLQRRRLTVERTGRGSAARPLRHAVWLPDADGSLGAVGADVVSICGDSDSDGDGGTPVASWPG